MEKFLEINIIVTGRYLDEVGQFVQVFRTADDPATQCGSLFSPEIYRNILKPYYKRYSGFIKPKTDAKIFYHSCGNITEILPELIDSGTDIINPVQISAIPDDAGLKKKYKNDIILRGFIDSQKRVH